MKIGESGGVIGCAKYGSSIELLKCSLEFLDWLSREAAVEYEELLSEAMMRV